MSAPPWCRNEKAAQAAKATPHVDEGKESHFGAEY